MSIEATWGTDTMETWMSFSHLSWIQEGNVTSMNTEATRSYSLCAECYHYLIFSTRGISVQLNLTPNWPLFWPLIYGSLSRCNAEISWLFFSFSMYVYELLASLLKKKEKKKRKLAVTGCGQARSWSGQMARSPPSCSSFLSGLPIIKRYPVYHGRVNCGSPDAPPGLSDGVMGTGLAVVRRFHSPHTKFFKGQKRRSLGSPWVFFSDPWYRRRLNVPLRSYS